MGSKKPLKWIFRSEINKAGEILNINDVIYVSKENQSSYKLEQIPEINGGIIVMDPCRKSICFVRQF